ncbi:MAG TPA: hypothetical protein VHE81_02670, partial [Lacipirellulaceae bacterium]|nr:hypothetical protein [Lacipirellulaceae bacterium]
NRPVPKPAPDAPPPKTTPYQDFLNVPVVEQLLAAGPDAQIRFEATDSYESRTYRDVTVQQRFSITPVASSSSKSGNHPVELAVTVERVRIAGESMSRWLIVRYQPVDSVK